MIAVVRQQWHDRRGAAVGWLAGWSVLVLMYVATWPTVRSHARQYDEILAGMPKAVRAAIGAEGSSPFSTPGGYLTAELLGITGPLIAVTMGVLLGVSSLARDEQEGTIELVLAQPLARRRLVFDRVLAGGLEVLFVLGMTAMLLWTAGLAVGLGLGLGACLRAFGMLALLTLQGLTLGVLVGAFTGRASRSRAVAGAVGLAAFLLATLGPSVKALSGAVPISPFRTLVASDPFRHGPPALHVLELAVPSVVFLVVAVLRFAKRDLRLT